MSRCSRVGFGRGKLDLGTMEWCAKRCEGHCMKMVVIACLGLPRG
jgi:hypothetical protein